MHWKSWGACEIKGLEKNSVLLVTPPLAWFLPGPVCMRGGAARRFYSGSGFCGGIHFKSTWRKQVKKITIYQYFTQSRLCRAGFFCQIHLAKSTLPNLGCWTGSAPQKPRSCFGAFDLTGSTVASRLSTCSYGEPDGIFWPRPRSTSSTINFDCAVAWRWRGGC